MCSNEEGQKEIYAIKNPKNLNPNQSSQQHASSHVRVLTGESGQEDRSEGLLATNQRRDERQEWLKDFQALVNLTRAWWAMAQMYIKNKMIKNHTAQSWDETSPDHINSKLQSWEHWFNRSTQPAHWKFGPTFPGGDMRGKIVVLQIIADRAAAPSLR